MARIAASGEERKSFLYLVITAHSTDYRHNHLANLPSSRNKASEDQSSQEDLFADGVKPVDAALQIVIAFSRHELRPRLFLSLRAFLASLPDEIGRKLSLQHLMLLVPFRGDRLTPVGRPADVLEKRLP